MCEYFTDYQQFLYSTCFEELQDNVRKKKLYKINLTTLTYFSLFWMTCKGQMGKKIKN